MTADDKNVAPPPSPAGDTPSHLPNASNARARTHRALLSFFVSVAFTLVLVALKTKFEGTFFGQQVEEMSYAVLQHHLTPPTADNLSVIVLDISGIPMTVASSLHPDKVTDRTRLSKIVSSLISEDDKPMAIGLDVDFSPSAYGYADAADEQIFKDFLKIQNDNDNKLPIRVGVNSSLGLGPEKWLLNPDYLNLASCVVVPTPEKGQSTRYMPEALDVDYRTPMAPYNAGETGHCPAMGFALVQASVPDVASWARPFLQSTVQKSGGPISKNEFLVDYSPLDLLSAAPPEIDLQTDLSNFKSQHHLKLAKKVVLIGRTKNTSDTFTVPGRPETPYAGVFLHACAAYTLLERPLYQLKEGGRLLVDLALSLGIFGIVLAFRLRSRQPAAEAFFEHRLPELLAVTVAITVFALELWLVPITHFMWDDFILVSLVLLAHSPIEHTSRRACSWLASRVTSWWDTPVPSSDSNSEGE
jgi:CHASE2 domain-containing sensor protein